MSYYKLGFLFGKSGVGFVPAGPVMMVADGNSLTAGFNGAGNGLSDIITSPTDTTKNDWPNLLRTDLANALYNIRNLGVSGQTTTDMSGDAVTQIDNIYYDATTYNGGNILTAWEITNEIAANVAEETAYQNFRTYCLNRRTKGWKVIVINMLHRTNNFTAPMDADKFLAIKNSINARLAVEWPNFADAFVDVDSLNVQATSGWDGTHPALEGYTLIKNAIKPVLINLLQFGSGYTGATINPPAPTSGVVDDTANTYDWTNAAGYNGVNNYEYSTDNGSTYNPVTSKPILVGNVAIASGSLKLRVKAATGRNASSVLSSPAAFTMSSSFDSDAQAFIDAAAITDNTQQNALNQLVLDLKAASIWTKMQALYPFIGGTASTHKFNLKNPLDTDAAFRLTFPNGATHSANGVDWNGSSHYANTHFIPGTHMTLNSTHYSYYSRENVNVNAIDMGSDDIYLQINFGVNDHKIQLYGGGTGAATTSSMPDSSGFFVGSRTANNSLKSYRNGSVVATQTGTSSTSPSGVTDKVYLGCRNNFGSPGNYSTRQCAFASIGTGLNDAEVSAMYTAVQAFQTSLSRNV